MPGSARKIIETFYARGTNEEPGGGRAVIVLFDPDPKPAALVNDYKGDVAPTGVPAAVVAAFGGTFSV